MENANPVRLPPGTGSQLQKDGTPSAVRPEVFGAPLYHAVCTCPDINIVLGGCRGLWQPQP